MRGQPKRTWDCMDGATIVLAGPAPLYMESEFRLVWICGLPRPSCLCATLVAPERLVCSLVGKCRSIYIPPFSVAISWSLGIIHGRVSTDRACESGGGSTGIWGTGGFILLRGHASLPVVAVLAACLQLIVTWKLQPGSPTLHPVIII